MELRPSSEQDKLLYEDLPAWAAAGYRVRKVIKLSKATLYASHHAIIYEVRSQEADVFFLQIELLMSGNRHNISIQNPIDSADNVSWSVDVDVDICPMEVQGHLLSYSSFEHSYAAWNCQDYADGLFLAAQQCGGVRDRGVDPRRERFAARRLYEFYVRDSWFNRLRTWSRSTSTGSCCRSVTCGMMDARSPDFSDPHFNEATHACPLEYVADKLNPILKPMTASVLKEAPEDVLCFIRFWLSGELARACGLPKIDAPLEHTEQKLRGIVALLVTRALEEMPDDPRGFMLRIIVESDPVSSRSCPLDYAAEYLNPIIKPMADALLQERPADIQAFICLWLSGHREEARQLPKAHHADPEFPSRAAAAIARLVDRALAATPENPAAFMVAVASEGQDDGALASMNACDPAACQWMLVRD